MTWGDTETALRRDRLLGALVDWRRQLRTRGIAGLALASLLAPLIGLPAYATWVGCLVATLLPLGLLMTERRLRRLSRGGLLGVGAGATLLLSVLLAGLQLTAAAASDHLGLTLGFAIATFSLVTGVLGSGGQAALFFPGLLCVALTLCLGLPLVASARGATLLEAGVLAASGLMAGGTGLLMWRWFTGALNSGVAARDRAEAATASKSRFVATVSHELRTPLSAIQAGALALRDRADADRAAADLIVDGSRMMRTLLDDLLDFSKLEAGRLAIEKAPFDLRRTLAGALAFWRADARRRRVRLRIVGARAIPSRAEGDPTRLKQILNNLMSNALKFSEGGRVTVVLTYDGALSISVRDTGIGMSPEQIGRLFQPFSQADPSIARQYGGTGLGLAISHDLALAMHGSLSVQSEPGVGSTFTLCIPMARFEGARQTTACGGDNATAESDFSGLQVLVVDDHEVNRRLLDLILQPAGAQITFAAGGGEALALAADRIFDVILLDVNMPGMDGYETARRLRSGGGNAATPIIAVTGAVTEADDDARRAATIGHVVAKPIEPSDLYAALERALEHTASRNIASPLMAAC